VPKLQQQMERIQRLPKAQQGLVMQMINAVLAQRDRWESAAKRVHGGQVEAN